MPSLVQRLARRLAPKVKVPGARKPRARRPSPTTPPPPRNEAAELEAQVLAEVTFAPSVEVTEVATPAPPPPPPSIGPVQVPPPALTPVRPLPPRELLPGFRRQCEAIDAETGRRCCLLEGHERKADPPIPEGLPPAKRREAELVSQQIGAAARAHSTGRGRFTAVATPGQRSFPLVERLKDAALHQSEAARESTTTRAPKGRGPRLEAYREKSNPNKEQSDGDL